MRRLISFLDIAVPERPHRSEAEWQSLVLEQADSGQSALDFCRERGLYAKTFYRHRKALRKKGLVPPPVRTPFVRVKTAPARPVSRPVRGVELHYGDSRLHLPTDIDPAWLALLMRRLA